MKKTILLTIAMFTVSAMLLAEERTKELNWSFSAETSYPKEIKKLEPADLNRRIVEIQKLNKGDPLSKECSGAIKKYGELIAKYPDRPEIYGEIPTCNLGERAFKVIFEMVSKAGDDAPAAEFVKFGTENQMLLMEYWKKADAYFSSALKDNAPAEIWDAYLNYNIARLGAAFANFMITDIGPLFAKKAGKEAMLDDLLGRIQQYMYEMAGDNNIMAAQHLHNAAPSDLRYSGILGSLLVGRGFTDIIGNMLKVARKDKSGKEFNAVPFIKKEVKKPNIAKALDDGIKMLTPVCASKKYEQACKDIELAQFLKNPIPPAN